MNTATINFSNCTSLTVEEGDVFVPLVKFDNVDKSHESPFSTFVGQSKPYELWYHVSAGLTPSILELLANSQYFKAIDSETVYSSVAVVSVENN